MMPEMTVTTPEVADIMEITGPLITSAGTTAISQPVFIL
jgi:hypothetical protein